MFLFIYNCYQQLCVLLECFLLQCCNTLKNLMCCIFMNVMFFNHCLRGDCDCSIRVSQSRLFFLELLMGPGFWLHFWHTVLFLSNRTVLLLLLFEHKLGHSFDSNVSEIIMNYCYYSSVLDQMLHHFFSLLRPAVTCTVHVWAGHIVSIGVLDLL